MVEKAHTAGGSAWWPNLYDPWRSLAERATDYFTPRADAAATEHYYEINVELPAMAKEDIDVNMHEHVVTISGEKKRRAGDDGKTFFFSERGYGAFQRSFRLPADAESDKITAEFKDGLLTIRAAKAGSPPERRQRIEVRGT